MVLLFVFFFFFKQKTAYEMQRGLVGSEMCIRDSYFSMGCGKIEKPPLRKIDHELGILMNLQLERWEAREIEIIMKKFKTIRKEGAAVSLRKADFETVFPGIRHFPELVRESVFKVFDKDDSGDIDFKEFCYTLTPVVHGSGEEQMKFIGELFDVSKARMITERDFSLALHSIIMINQRIDCRGLKTEEQQWIDSRIKELFNKTTFIEYDCLCSELSHTLPLHKIIELFEVIPSPRTEFETVSEILHNSKEKKSTQCYIISYKWWLSWQYYVSHSPNPLTPENINCSAVPNFTFFDEDDTERIRGQSFSASIFRRNSGIEVGDISIFADEVDRPNEIDNTPIEGMSKGLLKEGLQFKRDYIWVPPEVWHKLQEWYGGGPEFPRSLLYNSAHKPYPELYPPLLYACKVDENGKTVNSKCIPIIFSNHSTMEEVKIKLQESFQSSKEKTRVWYRALADPKWKLVEDYKKTVGEMALAYGDKLLLEEEANGEWPRKTTTKEEPEFEINQNIDVYIDKTWVKGRIIMKTPKKLEIEINKRSSTIELPLNSPCTLR
eukprot:TRINITY_DN1514_c0_g1_i1.p1 TRINITY_DN1514_c0_g1~~TRINITY_DN1514_c0_g1_i1.p1  ORF type:complete len:551 (+),score=94.09 TRINITY_DN1514_c0_g1_i1:68-1720(+)